ncbi:MAG TPA: hypothetical protein VFT99_22320, partial [Roseiflexaceae bacterium]|nr:hypothetical protein [Roseiflexaceae bacterium]
GIAIRATDATPPRALADWQRAGAHIRTAPSSTHHFLGQARRDAVAFGLELPGDVILFCDLDRLMHWVEYYPDELAATLNALGDADFTVLGRTARAFASHPLTQTTTEAIVNEVFGRVSGRRWDVTAAARGMRRAAAEAIVAGYTDNGIGSDTGWPLFVKQAGLQLAYIETEGLEFETPDRYADEIAAAGGLAAWLEQSADNLQEWLLRLEIAHAELAALKPFEH